ncbi:hypothetical protein GALL_466670 [mine drainage metagenome]|uniref:Uncharacterized protein n=1 Tax=mine drainage metagenome TaxID=410659 RepID=A0A1J5PKP6_9ZZZZ
MLFSIDLHEYFVEVPSPAARSHPRNPTFSDFRGEQRTEAVPPKPNRFVADLNAALMQQVLNVAQRQRISNIHHHRQADDFGRRLEVPEPGSLGHGRRLRDRPARLKDFALTAPLNKIHAIKTVDRVAAELGETVDRLHDLAIGMEPEDGIIWVYGIAEVEVLAFTPFGVKNLLEMIAMERDHHIGLHRMDTPKSAGQRSVKRLFYWGFMLSAVSGWHVRRCAVAASAGLIPSTAGHIGAACRNVCRFRARPDAQFADTGTQTALVHPDGLSDRPAAMKSLVFSVPPRGQVGSASIAQIALVT